MQLLRQSQVYIFMESLFLQALMFSTSTYKPGLFKFDFCSSVRSVQPLHQFHLDFWYNIKLTVLIIHTLLQDRTVKVWRAEDGILCRTLTGHAHWINTLALNVEYALRTSYYEPLEQSSVLSDDLVGYFVYGQSFTNKHFGSYLRETVFHFQTYSRF